MASKKDPGMIAVVYAEALFGEARDAKALERVETELTSLDQALRKDVQLQRFFDTPTVPFPAKQKVIEEVLKDFLQLTKNFLYVAIEHGRVPHQLSRIIFEFHALCNQEGGIAELELKSARKFEFAELEKLKEVMKKKLGRTVVIHEKVAPELLGGFVLAHGNTVWNASKTHHLGRLVDTMEATKAVTGFIKED